MDALAKLAAAQDGVVTKGQALAAGLRRQDIDGLVRSGRWQRLARGTYLVFKTRDRIARRAQVRAAVASLGPDAIAVLGTAAELHGIGGLRATETIHVSLPGPAARPARLRDPAIVIHQLTIPDSARSVIGGIPVTTALHTVADLILRVDRYAAICLLDSALNLGRIDPTDLGAVQALIRGRRGAVAARCYLAEADGRAQSPLETRVRLRCVDGRVPPDALQHVVRDEDGYVLGQGDLAWRRARLLGEADGKGPHSQPWAVFDDRRRQNRLVNAGWLVLRFTWSDTLRPDDIPHIVSEALRLRNPRPR